MHVQKKHHDSIHDFFHTFSRIIIVLPFIIIIFAIILKVSKSDTVMTGQSAAPLVTPATIMSTSQSNASINLQKPSLCSFQTKEASWSAFIRNRMIKVINTNNITTSYYLLKNDCFYTWEKNKYSGEKMCGVGQFVSVGENLVNSGLMSEDMFNIMQSQLKINVPLSIQYSDIQKIISSCKSSSDIPLSQFELPKQVLFKSK